MTLLCVVPACQPLIAEHLQGCEDDRCRGCCPKPVKDGLQTCAACERRVLDHLADLPRLDRDLLTPTRAPGTGGGPAGLDPDADVPATLAQIPGPAADGPLEVRSRIRIAATTWTRTLRDGFAIPAPADDRTATLVEHIAWYSLTFLADQELAAQFAGDVDQLWRDATRQAYPAGPGGQALGACPTCATVVRSSTTYGKVECRGCGAVRTVEQWQQLLVGDLAAETSAIAPDLCAWLSGRHDRPVQHTTLRQWASRGVLLPKPGGGRERVHLAALGTDRYSRVLYSVADAARIAHGLYGPARHSLTT